MRDTTKILIIEFTVAWISNESAENQRIARNFSLILLYYQSSSSFA